jgi:ABC-type multidrug transport system ATPase subunit
VKGLRKVFGKTESSKVAVQGTHLDIFEGEILSLLGHNGLYWLMCFLFF